MRKDLAWFFHLCIEQGLLDVEQVHGTLRSIDSETTLEEIAEILIQAGWVTDQNQLGQALEEAVRHQKKRDDAPVLPHLDRTDPKAIVPDISEFSALQNSDLREAILNWISSCQASGVSDIHITAGAPLRVRHHREIMYLTDTPLDVDLAEKMVFSLLSDTQKTTFLEDWELDFALSLGERADGLELRLRANVQRHQKGLSAVFHMPHAYTESLEDLGFPNADAIRKLLSYQNGLILVAGPVGSGKTTTLASLVRELNENRKCHIIAIEDPIEVVQSSGNSVVTQREIGSHVESFERALKSSLREDPDVIIVGELRDLETIEMAVTAAETGHLVIGTLHTGNSVSTLNRILNVFPPVQQSQIRAMTADSLRGIICQKLVPATDGGVALICELMLNTPAIANLIRESKDSSIGSVIQTGKRLGMRTSDESVIELLKVGRISQSVAEDLLQNPSQATENS